MGGGQSFGRIGGVGMDPCAFLFLALYNFASSKEDWVVVLWDRTSERGLWNPFFS